MVFQHNPTDVSVTQSNQIVSEAQAQWNAVSPVPIVSSNFGTNTFSYSSDPRFFGPGVVAVTILNYGAGVGRVSSGQILVNQAPSRSFCLTADKSATSCSVGGSFGLNKVYLGDVVAHEMGHLLGLAHSEVRDSTMLFATFKGQHSLHADDVAGVKKVYGVTGLGSLSGTVMGGNRVPVFGAHVQAISTKTGIVAASAISQENGSFVIPSLPTNDTYYLYVEPLRYLEGLSDAYRSVQNNFCPGDYVGSYFETCGSSGRGHPQPLKLTSAAPDMNIGVLTVRCQMRLGEDYLREKLDAGMGQYSFVATSQKPGEAFTGLYPSTEVLSSASYSTTQTDSIELDFTGLNLPSGSITLDLKLITTALGSPLDFSVEIDGPSGVVIDPDRPVVGGSPALALEAGTLRPKYDRKLTYALSSNPALNRVTVKLHPRALSTYETAVHMPLETYFVLGDRPWFLIASISRNGEIYYQNQTSVRSDNSACLDAPYAFGVKANPVSAAAIAGEGSDSDTTTQAGTSCGTWEPPDSGGSGPGTFFFTMLVGCFVILSFGRKTRRL